MGCRCRSVAVQRAACVVQLYWLERVSFLHGAAARGEPKHPLRPLMRVMDRQREQYWINRRRHRRRWGRLMAAGCAGASFLMGLSPAAAPRGEDVHRADANCRVCHTADRTTLNSNPARARVLLIPNLEATCNRCHGSEGPSHKTGMKATTRVPADLPLDPDGIVGCATCHFMHGENNRFGDFLRIDNRRGKLCLSCHKISELR